MNTNRDDLITYDMTGIGFFEDSDLSDNSMNDEEYAVWAEAEARRDYEAYITAQADDEADEAGEMARMEREVADLDDETLAEEAEEARIMFPNSPWGRLVIAAYEERLAERAAREENRRQAQAALNAIDLADLADLARREEIEALLDAGARL